LRLVLVFESWPEAALLRRFLDELLVELFTGLSADLLIGLSAELRLSLSGSLLECLPFGVLELPAEPRTSLWASAFERLFLVLPSGVLRFLAELPIALSVSGSVS
jgi:hypothetical protein